MDFGVIRIKWPKLLEYLAPNAPDKDPSKEIQFKTKTVYLWAVSGKWPPTASGLANSKKAVEQIAKQHGFNFKINFLRSHWANESFYDYAIESYGDPKIHAYIERQTGLYFVCIWENKIQFLLDIPPIIELDNIPRHEAMAMYKYWLDSRNQAKSWNANYIHTYIRRREAKRKHSKPTDDGQAFHLVEFVYSPEREWRLPRKRWNWQRHRIVKKTKKYLFVEEQPYFGSSYLKDGWQAFIVYTIMIDRAAFESDHEFHHRSRHKTFFAKQAASDSMGEFDDFYDSLFSDLDNIDDKETQKNLKTLGITKKWPVSKTEIIQAYKKAAQINHSDREGGSHAIMSEINKAKSALLKLLKK